MFSAAKETLDQSLTLVSVAPARSSSGFFCKLLKITFRAYEPHNREPINTPSLPSSSKMVDKRKVGLA